MSRRRDTQRSLVYSWERRTRGCAMHREDMSLEECEAMMERVWRAERGRYGMGRAKTPMLQRVHWGQQSALSHGGAVSLPRWARNPWVILHEIAHELTKGDGHGSRFVGVLIGLAARHIGADPHELLVSAEEMGVKVKRGSVGATPAHTLPVKVLRMLPGKPVEIAVRLAIEQGLCVTFRQVQGAAMRLARDGKARWRGTVIVPVEQKEE